MTDDKPLYEPHPATKLLGWPCPAKGCGKEAVGPTTPRVARLRVCRNGHLSEYLRDGTTRWVS